MPCVTWSRLGTVAALLLLALTAGNAKAAGAGPRLALLRWTIRPAAVAVQTTDDTGGAAELLVDGNRQAPIPFPLSSLSWSGDGSLLAFTGLSGSGHSDLESSGSGIFVISADGGKARAVTGTSGGQFPVLSPDGHSVAFVRVRGSNSSWSTSGGKHGRTYARTSIWLVAIDGDAARRLTPWRKQTQELPSSFSPDGTTLAITQRPIPDGPSRALALPLDGGGPRLIAEDAAQPVFSPDGSRVALIGIADPVIQNASGSMRAPGNDEPNSDLFIANSDGSGRTQVTRTRAIEEFPSWDPSGQRLAYVRLAHPLTERTIFGLGDSVMEVNADGSCPTRILSSPGVAFLSPAWQPGPGREAGSIAC